MHWTEKTSTMSTDALHSRKSSNTQGAGRRAPKTAGLQHALQRGSPKQLDVRSASDFVDLMSLAIEGSGTGLWDRSVTTGEIWYSRGWKAILGYDESELSNRIEQAYTRVHPDDLSYVQTTMQAHFEGITESYEVEHRLRCKDGSWKWVLSRGKVVERDPTGYAIRMVGTTTDITATRALAEDLRRSISLVTNLTDEIPGFVFQCRSGSSSGLTFGFASKGILEIFELPVSTAFEHPESIIGRIHVEDRETFHESLRTSAAHLTPWHVEYRVTLPRQGLRWHQADGRPFRESDGSTTWHGLIIDVTERKRLEGELRTLARIDSLTQLPNRRSFWEKLEAELEQIKRRRSEPAAVIMLDIDHFKRINDRHGHAAGDNVIRTCANLLGNEARWRGDAGRLGGEEFAVILPDTGGTHAEAFAARLRRRIAENPAEFDGLAIPFTVSIGVTVMTYLDESPDAALARADMALYRAKKTGRDRVECCLAASPVGSGTFVGARQWRSVAAEG